MKPFRVKIAYQHGPDAPLVFSNVTTATFLNEGDAAFFAQHAGNAMNREWRDEDFAGAAVFFGGKMIAAYDRNGRFKP